MTEHEEPQPQQGASLLSCDDMHGDLVELFLRRHDEGDLLTVSGDLEVINTSTGGGSSTSSASFVVDSSVLQLHQWVQQQRRCQSSSLLSVQRDRLKELGFQWDEEAALSRYPFLSVPWVSLGTTTAADDVPSETEEDDDDAAHPPLPTKKRPICRTAAAAAGAAPVAGDKSTVSVPGIILDEPASETVDNKTAATAGNGATQERIQEKKHQISNSSDDKSNKKSRFDNWQQNFELLREFQRNHGHCRIPQRLVTDSSVNLGEWVKSQRKLYRKCGMVAPKTDGCTNVSSINAEHIARLNSIGSEWSVRTLGGWQQKFELLQEFQREHGHCRVPQCSVTDCSVKLGEWVNRQRQYYRNRTEGKKGDKCITEERIAQLNLIGFDW